MSEVREVPEGFQLDWDKESWNVGHVFTWSEFYECYLKDGIITVRPNETLPEAYEREYDMPLMDKNVDIFFAEGMYTA